MIYPVNPDDIDTATKQAIIDNYRINKNLVECEKAFNIDKRVISQIVKSK